MSCVAQRSPSASSALSGSTYLTISKDHLSYSIMLTEYVKHKGACISKLYNETWGPQSNKVARRAEAHLGCKFHDQPRHSQIHPMSPPAKVDRVDLLNFFSTRLVVTLGESGIAHDKHETWAVYDFDPDEQVCSIKGPVLHWKILSYRCLHVLTML
ncbi:predicted protein [Lichtheimia corymbifera JMRC:FSU:9682]|uniref:Uncharacterized protein n=1 Tax=Lichtheimia corymbifera JMRC:FSU:9682 TaxID=1263082 RepID=A0A068S3H4_9FUNG|nr:predicted protein [Lichtheimia corymbifera JMRC:FSU:9682]